MVTAGQVPLGLVCSLLDLPRPRSSSIYSSQHPSPSHRTATIIGIFFSDGSPEQRTPLAPCWVTVVHHLLGQRTTSPCRDCRGTSPSPLPCCSAAGNSWLPPAVGVVAGKQSPSLATVVYLLGFGSYSNTLSNLSQPVGHHSPSPPLPPSQFAVVVIVAITIRHHRRRRRH